MAYLIQLRFKGPPAAATFLPGLWLLAPGALGLLSVTRMMSDQGAAGLYGMVTVVIVIASIALGNLVGASIYPGLSETFGARTTADPRIQKAKRQPTRKPSAS